MANDIPGSRFHHKLRLIRLDGMIKITKLELKLDAHKQVDHITGQEICLLELEGVSQNVDFFHPSRNLS